MVDLGCGCSHDSSLHHGTDVRPEPREHHRRQKIRHIHRHTEGERPESLRPFDDRSAHRIEKSAARKQRTPTHWPSAFHCFWSLLLNRITPTKPNDTTGGQRCNPCAKDRPRENSHKLLTGLSLLEGKKPSHAVKTGRCYRCVTTNR